MKVALRIFALTADFDFEKGLSVSVRVGTRKMVNYIGVG